MQQRRTPAACGHGGTAAADLLPCGCDANELAAEMGVPKEVLLGSTAPTEGPWPNARRDSRAGAEVARHFGARLGPLLGVLHDPDSTLVHVDLHAYAPTRARPYLHLMTIGMSARRMTLPPRTNGVAAHAELIISVRVPALRALLVPDAPRFPEWTVPWLLDLARLPHKRRTFFAAGQVVDFDNDVEPGCPFGGAVLANAGWPGTALPTLHRSDGGRVRLLQVLPVFASELDLVRENGFGPRLLDLLAERGEDFAFRTDRPPLVPA